MTATVGVGSFEQATGRSPEDTSGAAQRRYRAFQLELIRPHLGRSLLEVGAGLGEFADQLTGLDRHVVTDLDPLAVEALATRFADRPEVRARVLDLAAGDPDLDRTTSADRSTASWPSTSSSTSRTTAAHCAA